MERGDLEIFLNNVVVMKDIMKIIQLLTVNHVKLKGVECVIRKEIV